MEGDGSRPPDPPPRGSAGRGEERRARAGAGVLAMLLLGAAATGGCHGAPASTGDDDATGEGEADDDEGPAEPPPWEAGLPATAELQADRRGWVELRGIVHLHSPLSHDACDNDPFPDGVFNEECLQSLRGALCTTRQDFAFLTDHTSFAADFPWRDLLEMREGDEEALDAAGQVAGMRMACGDGASVLWMPGIEGNLMPVGLRRHAGADDDPQANADVYGGTSEEAIEAMHAAGALVLVQHAEGVPLDTMRALPGIDGMEVYNLHANVAPNIREEDLGLDPWDWLEDVSPFLDDGPEGPEPDLVVLGFWTPNEPDRERLDTLLSEGRRLVAVAGTDAHENSLPMLMRDGERVDSYRRMLRWFSNHVLAEDDGPDAVRQALADGRSWVVFETFGIPEGFDAVAVDSGGGVHEMGSTVDSAGTVLKVTAPRLMGGDPAWADAPEVTVRLIRASAPVGEVVAEAEGDLEYAEPAPGAYRVEVDIVPHHLAPYLGADPSLSTRTVAWIYSSPFYVQ